MDSTNERNSNVNGDNVMDCDDATISLIPNNEKIANNENIDNDQSSSAVHADQNDIESNIIDNIDVAVISKNGSKQQNDSTDDIGVDAPLMDTVPFEEDVVQSDDSALSLSIVSTYNDDAIASNSIDKQDTVNGGRKETAVRELDGAEEIPAKRQKISDDAVDTSSGSVISMPSSSLILHNDDDDNFNDNGRAKNDGIAAASDEGHDESVGCGNEAPKQPEISEAGEKLILTATEDDIADCNDDEGTVIRQRVVGNAAGQGYQENNTKFGPSSINEIKADDLQTSTSSEEAMAATDGHVKCLHKGCTNLAVTNVEWENVYCSNECVINHTKDVFAEWINKRRQTLASA